MSGLLPALENVLFSDSLGQQQLAHSTSRLWTLAYTLALWLTVLEIKAAPVWMFQLLVSQLGSITLWFQFWKQFLCYFSVGVGIYHSRNGLISNNSVVMASNGVLQGSFFCLSGKAEAGIGRWIAPNGDDFTHSETHPFEATVGGENNPGVVEISLSSSESRFPAGHWDGIYSCVIPDQTGTEQIIYLGVYIMLGRSFQSIASQIWPYVKLKMTIRLFSRCTTSNSIIDSFSLGTLSSFHTKLLIGCISCHRSHLD